jgi:hypothetical protein
VRNLDTSGVPTYRYTGQRFHTVSVGLSEEAQSKLAKNREFSPDALKDTVKRALEAKGLLNENADYSVNITVTDVRVRSMFSAVMFGAMAGDDRIVGTVTLTDNTNKPVTSFEVSVYYALGGVLGGIDRVRMDWLYEKFAELTVAGLTGEKTN